MTFAVINAKYFDQRDDSFVARNVMVQGSTISGVGYIPDEDEDQLTVIDGAHCDVPSVTDFCHAVFI